MAENINDLAGKQSQRVPGEFPLLHHCRTTRYVLSHFSHYLLHTWSVASLWIKPRPHPKFIIQLYVINQSIAGLDEDISGIADIMERKPSGNTKYRSIGESIILGAASAALTGDRSRPNIPQLVKHPSQLQHSVWIFNF